MDVERIGGETGCLCESCCTWNGLRTLDGGVTDLSIMEKDLKAGRLQSDPAEGVEQKMGLSVNFLSLFCPDSFREISCGGSLAKLAIPVEVFDFSTVDTKKEDGILCLVVVDVWVVRTWSYCREVKSSEELNILSIALGIVDLATVSV